MNAPSQKETQQAGDERCDYFHLFIGSVARKLVHLPGLLFRDGFEAFPSRGWNGCTTTA